MKLSRLIQPRNPLFWLLVVINLLSTAIAHILQRHELSPLPTLVLAAFAIGNVIYGIWIGYRLINTPEPTFSQGHNSFPR